MQDVLLKYDPDSGLYDMQLNKTGTDFAGVEGFETAIEVSLFTDKRAPEYLIPDPFYRRGWQGNLLTKEEGFELGSLLWLLDQSRLNQIIMNEAESFVKESLEWIVNLKAIKSVEVTVLKRFNRDIQIKIKIINQENNINRYVELWRSGNADNLS